jgi:hypothetical protein
MTRDFEARDLIVDHDVSHYDGTTAVVRSEHLSAEDIEFMRWRADRWMKVGHIPAAFAHSPLFVLRNSRKMLSHTFAGSSLRSMLGLEDERAVFARYRERRRSERAVYRAEAAEPETADPRLIDGSVRAGNPRAVERAGFH